MAKWKLELLKAAKHERSAERILRGGKALTLEEIAEAAGIPKSTVAQYLDGRVVSPDLEKVALLCSLLGLQVKDLIEVDDTGNHSAPRSERRAEVVSVAPVLGG